MSTFDFPLDPTTDLHFDRIVDVPPHLVWKAWTVPEHIMPWFCPVPWKTTECEVDLRPGGKFYTKMVGPEGESFAGTSCYLETIANQRLVWSSALLPGFRPRNDFTEHSFPFTAILLFEPNAAGTKYTAIARHLNPEQCKQHADMGFVDGWGTALTQLVAYAKANLMGSKA